MAILSANNMIRSISLFHLTLAVILVRNPSLLSNQSIVLLLGESMQLPTPRDFAKPSAATAFLAILFALIGLSDLAALSLPEAISDEFWGLQAPVRLLFLFCLTAYAYVAKEGGMLAPRGSVDYRMSAGAGLNNSLVFTWGFMEVAAWFWVYSALREERVAKANKEVERKKREEDRL
ncbi:hypothetical protein BDW02DRAFT_493367 [Decorospora gaudefroyi]|uniref:Increased loss of mitochondrial DNA protein 1 n=1 Tax=Decorospora gaudefroyi TaxID=184978 RepID=A0A6A5KLX8_9PLEO|nr:hypothetical protein BDW02DRAFT_493367 [Decorospora gaudefroyi]